MGRYNKKLTCKLNTNRQGFKNETFAKYLQRDSWWKKKRVVHLKLRC